MSRLLMIKIVFIGMLLSVATMAMAQKNSLTGDMTCKEFLDLNPKAMAPVVYWMMNEDIQYKGGDYVDLHETDTIATPKVVELCSKTPEKKLSDIKDDILGFFKKQ